MKKIITIFILVITAVVITISTNINKYDIKEVDKPVTNDYFVTNESFYYILKAPEDNNTGITFIILPGGGYSLLGLRGMDSLTEILHNKGINVVILYYKTMQNINFFDFPLSDLQALIVKLRKDADKLNIKKDKIGLYGISAGGHLAAMSSVHFSKKTRPDFVLLISPAVGISLDSRDFKYMRKVKKSIFMNYFFPEKFVSEKTSPTYITSGEKDDIIPIKYNELYAQKLKDKNVNYVLKKFPNEPHSTWVLATQELDNMIEWIKNLK